MERKIKGYRVSISYTVHYDPESEVPGISIFYPEGHTDLERSDRYWDDCYNAFGHEYTKEEAIADVKQRMEEWVYAGRYQRGTLDIQKIECTPLYR